MATKPIMTNEQVYNLVQDMVNEDRPESEILARLINSGYSRVQGNNILRMVEEKLREDNVERLKESSAERERKAREKRQREQDEFFERKRRKEREEEKERSRERY